MARGFILGVALAATACGPGQKGYLAFPPVPGAKSYLWLDERRDDPSVGLMFAADTEDRFELSADSVVTVFAFSETLDAMRVEPGPVHLATPMSGAITRAFPAPLETSALRIDASRRSATWEHTTATIPEIFVAPTECAEWQILKVIPGSMLGTTSVVSAVAADPATLLLSTGDELTWVTEAGVTKAPAPSGGVYGAFVNRGVITYSSMDGTIYRGTVDGSGIRDTRVLTKLPAALSAESLAGSVDGMFDLYALQGGHPRHFDGTEWSDIGARQVEAFELVYAPNERAAYGRARNGILRLTPTSLSVDPLENMDYPTALGFDGSNTPIVGSYGSDIYRRENGAWVKKFPSTTGYWVLSVASYEDGFIMMVASGGLIQWRPAVGLCPESFPTTTSMGGELFVSGDRAILVAEDSTQQASVIFMRRI